MTRLRLDITQVRLFEASQTERLYPLGGGGSGVEAQGNVSAVDVERPDRPRLLPDDPLMAP